MDDASRARFAALVASEVDRVVIGVHLASRPDGREVLHEFGLSSAVPLVELRLGLPRGPIPVAQARAVFRYVEDADFQAALDRQVAEGVLIVEGGQIVLTDLGREVCRALSAAHQRTVGTLWAPRPESLPGLAETAGQLVTAALIDTGLVDRVETGGQAFLAAAPPYEPVDASPGLRLFGRLCALRLHRADAHAAAWAEAGLSREQLAALPAGPRRTSIEDRTNDRAAVPFAVLTDAERRDFALGLAALPG